MKRKAAEDPETSRDPDEPNQKVRRVDHVAEHEQNTLDAPDREASVVQDVYSRLWSCSRVIYALQQLQDDATATIYFSWTQKRGWTVRFHEFLFSELKGFEIHNYKRASASHWTDPLNRASRWSQEDRPMCFYDAQLMHRGLPTTTCTEVAKWRLASNHLTSTKVMSCVQQIQQKLKGTLGEHKAELAIRVLPRPSSGSPICRWLVFDYADLGEATLQAEKADRLPRSERRRVRKELRYYYPLNPDDLILEELRIKPAAMLSPRSWP